MSVKSKQNKSVDTTAKDNVSQEQTPKQKVWVVTEQDIAKKPLACGYDPYVVVQMNFRITNVLYNEIEQRCQRSGYKNVSEYFQQAAREKLYFDELAETDINVKRGMYR